MTDGADAFARANVTQREGSRLRVVHFRGGDIVYDRDDQLVLSMGLTADHSLRYAVGRKHVDVVPIIGKFGLMTAGERFKVTLRGDCVVIQMVLPSPELSAWLSEDHEVDGDRTEIGYGHALDDPVITHLLMSARLAGPDGEQVILRRVAARLLERFSASSSTLRHARGGLPPHKLRRVIEWIEDGPDDQVSVDALARAVAMSPFHFAHQFSQATGRSPHRFIVERRVSRAIALLGQPNLSVSTIATRCGFAHGSHLARQLRRLFGQSPQQLRRELLL